MFVCACSAVLCIPILFLPFCFHISLNALSLSLAICRFVCEYICVTILLREREREPFACLRFYLGSLFCFMISFRGYTHSFAMPFPTFILFALFMRCSIQRYTTCSVVDDFIVCFFMLFLPGFFSTFSCFIYSTDLMDDDPKNMCCVY